MARFDERASATLGYVDVQVVLGEQFVRVTAPAPGLAGLFASTSHPGGLAMLTKDDARELRRTLKRAIEVIEDNEILAFAS